VLDLNRSTDTRLTFTEDRALTPVWSPDGQRFAYVFRGAGGDVIHIGSADGLGVQDSIRVPPTFGATLFQWADSRLLFASAQFKGYAVSSDGTSPRPEPLPSDSTLVMAQQQISPDGRFLAYVTGNNTNVNIYVQSLVGPPGRWQISNRPAFWPRWTKGGRELVYEGLDGHLMAVDIDTKAGFHAGTPHVLFATPKTSDRPEQFTWSCDAAGEKFYVVFPPKIQRTGNIEVVTAFNELVTRR
jgi:hypothetical protein